jgi:hypothetical protein
MATLRQTLTETSTVLETEHLVGRSPHAALKLAKPYVSAQHALLRWIGNGWELRDLGSRNGTFLNDAAVAPGQAYKLSPGDKIAFGRAEQTWQFMDESPPRAMVVALEGAEGPIFVEGDVLALPSADDPRATVFHGSSGEWFLERADETVPLNPQSVFDVAGRGYRFSCPNVIAETSTVDWPTRQRLVAEIRLSFKVSSDEEHVELEAQVGRQCTALGSRTHNYLLLLLARRRLADAAQELKETACGWLYQDELADALRISPEHLTIDIFRIRKQFGTLGLTDPARIIERRPGTKQLRIGAGGLTVRGI